MSRLPHPTHQIVFSVCTTNAVREVEAELGMLVDASEPCMDGYVTSTFVEEDGGTVTLYVVAHVSNITEFMRRVTGNAVLSEALL